MLSNILNIDKSTKSLKCNIQALKEKLFCGEFIKMLQSSGDCRCIGSGD